MMAICVSGDGLVFAEPTRSVVLVTVAEATCTVWSENNVGVYGICWRSTLLWSYSYFSKVYSLYLYS